MAAARSILLRSRRPGFTLIEMLIVVAIVAVLATTVVLGLGVANRGASAQIEANRLTESLGTAVDEVLVTRRPLALAWDEKGYGFVTQGADGRWTPDASPRLGQRHDLPGGLILGGDTRGLIVIGADGAPSPAQLLVTGRKGAWTIAFDGLGATASPAGAA